MPVQLVADPASIGQSLRPVARFGIQGQRRCDPIRIQNVLSRREIVEQREILKDETDLAGAKPATRSVGKPCNLVPGHCDPATVGRQDPGDQVQKSCLATAARSDDGQAFAVRQCK